jgi:hypothetical protein
VSILRELPDLAQRMFESWSPPHDLTADVAAIRIEKSVGPAHALRLVLVRGLEAVACIAHWR